MRLETKYFVNNLEYELIKNHLILKNYNLDNNCKNFKTYNVVSIYFDNHKFDSFNEKINGIRGRFKLRLRSYDNFNKTICLEIKNKKNYLIWKDKFYFKKNEVTRYLYGEKNNFYNFLKFNFPNYKPVCIVSYDRLAFIKKENDNVERYSFDKNLKFSYGYFNILNLISKNKISNWEKNYDNKVIFEIKTNNEQILNSNILVKKFNLNWVEISKYILAMGKINFNSDTV